MTDYYVSTTGIDNTSQSGAIGQPWASVTWAARAAGSLGAGDRILVRGGNYAQQIFLEKYGNSATLGGGRLTVENYPDETPVFQGVAGQQKIAFIDVPYVTLKGLKFSYIHAAPAGNYKWPWIHVIGSVSRPVLYVDLIDLNIERAYTGGSWGDINNLLGTLWNDYGVMLEDCSYATLRGATIRGVNKGVEIKDQALHSLIVGCDIQYVKQSCIVKTASASILTKAVIDQCNLGHSAMEDGIQCIPEGTSTTDKSNWGLIIRRCYIHDNAENAIDCKGAQFVVIEQNLIANQIGSNNGWLNDGTSTPNRNSMFAIGRGANTISENVTIRYNVLINNGGGIRVLPGWRVYNNTVLSNNHDYTGSESAAGVAQDVFSGIKSVEIANRMLVANNIIGGHKGANLVARFTKTAPSYDLELRRNLYIPTQQWYNYFDSPQLYTTEAAYKAVAAGTNWTGPKDSNALTATFAQVAFEDLANPPTAADPTVYNANLKSTSIAKSAGGPVNKATNSGSNSTSLQVAAGTAHTFFDGFGSPYVSADYIVIAGSRVQISSINYASGDDTITLATPTTWANGDDIYFDSATPDIGASPFQPDVTPPPVDPGGGSDNRMLGFWFTADTAGGTQAIAFPETLSRKPDAYLFFVTNCTASDSLATSTIIGIGMASVPGAVAQCVYAARARDAQNPTVTSRKSDKTACIMVLNPASTSTLALGAYSDAATSTTNLSISWTTTPTAAYLIYCVPIICEDAKVVIPTLDTVQNNSVTLTAGFAWNAAWGLLNSKPIPNSSTHAYLSFGQATYLSSTLKQRCIALHDRSAISPSGVGLYPSAAYFLAECAYGTGALQVAWEMTSPSGTGVALTTRTAAASEALDAGVLFVKFDATVRLYNEWVATPASPDSDYLHSLGWLPKFAMSLQTQLTSIAAGLSDVKAGALGFGFYDGTRQAALGVADEDGQTTSDGQSLMNTGSFAYLPESDGTEDAALIGAALGFASTGLRVNYSTVAAQYILLFGMEDPPADSIVADFAADVTSGVAPLTVVFTASNVATGTTVTGHAWDFGDGATATTNPATHVYTTAAEYTVTYTANDGGSVTDTEIKTAYIVVTSPAPAPPSVAGTPVMAGVYVPLLAVGDVRAGVLVIP